MDEISCWQRKKLTENKNPTVSRTFDRMTKISARCVVFNSKKNKLIKEQKAEWLLSRPRLKASLIRVMSGLFHENIFPQR